MLKREEKKVIGVYKNNTPISRIYKNGYLVFGSFPEPPVDEYEGYNFVFEWTGEPCSFYVGGKYYTPTSSPALYSISGKPYTMYWDESQLTNLTRVYKFPDTSNVTSYNRFFYGASKLAQITWGDFATDSATSMNSMFCGCSGLTSLNLSSFNTSNVTNMSYMFYGCRSLPTIKFPANFGTACKDMSYMFYGCWNLTSLNLGNFVTSNVTKMNSMFYGCSGLTSLDISKLDTSKVTDMGYMFRDCTSLEFLTLGYVHCPTIDSSMVYNSPLKSLLWDNMGEATNYSTRRGITLTAAPELGAGDYHDDFVYTFVTHSYDRVAAGMSNFTVELNNNVENNITQEEIAAMTAKGYSVSFN